MPTDLTRRHFLYGAVAASTACQTATEQAEAPGGLPSRPLGRTGATPSILAMG